MKHKTWMVLILALLVGLALAACGGTPASNSKPALPAPAVEGGGGGEGGGGSETARGPTLTNPGNLPPAPETNNANANSQFGEERMAKVEDPTGQFTILFVDGWTQEPGSGQDSLRSAQGDWIAEVETIPSSGQSPEQVAQALDASRANGATGYQKLALQTGDVHGLPAASLIYQYESGSNSVTGKALRFIASQVFIGGGPADKLGHITVSAPYTVYGDVSEIFDKILAGFTWK